MAYSVAGYLHKLFIISLVEKSTQMSQASRVQRVVWLALKYLVMFLQATAWASPVKATQNLCAHEDNSLAIATV